MVSDGDCFPPPSLDKEVNINSEVKYAMEGIKVILEREIEFLQRQIKARGLGMNEVDMAALEVDVRPILLAAVEKAAGH